MDVHVFSFAFVDWTGRAIREDKRGAIRHSLPPVLRRLGIDADEWLKTMRPNGSRFVRGIGSKKVLQAYARGLVNAGCMG